MDKHYREESHQNVSDADSQNSSTSIPEKIISETYLATKHGFYVTFRLPALVFKGPPGTLQSKVILVKASFFSFQKAKERSYL